MIITEDEALKDFPRGSRRNTIDRQRHGAAALGWYRGKQAGVYEAYCAIRKRYPRVAKFLLNEFNMNEDGSK